MGFRRFFRIASICSALFLVQGTFLQNDKIDCNNINLRQNQSTFYNTSFRYISGKGKEFIDCMNKRYKRDYLRISNIMGISDRGRIPLEYAVLPENEVAIYSTREGKIIVDTNKTPYFNGKLDCRVLSHELTHAFQNKKWQSLDDQNWLEFSNSSKKVDIISEGLATYIGMGEKLNTIPSNWPKTSEQLYCSNPYILGDFMVTKPLEEFGNRAIPVMAKNQPSQYEILHPQQWQARIRDLITSQR